MVSECVQAACSRDKEKPHHRKDNPALALSVQATVTRPKGKPRQTTNNVRYFQVTAQWMDRAAVE